MVKRCGENLYAQNKKVLRMLFTSCSISPLIHPNILPSSLLITALVSMATRGRNHSIVNIWV